MSKNNIQTIYERLSSAQTEGARNQILSELYVALLPYSENLVKRFLSREDSELAHDIVVKCVMGLHKFAGGCLLTTWFRKLAFHECISCWRKQSARELVSLEDLPRRDFKSLATSSKEMELKADIKNRISRVSNSLAPFGEMIVETLVNAGSIAETARTLKIDKSKLLRLVHSLQGE